MPDSDEAGPEDEPEALRLELDRTLRELEELLTAALLATPPPEATISSAITAIAHARSLAPFATTDALGSYLGDLRRLLGELERLGIRPPSRRH